MRWFWTVIALFLGVALLEGQEDAKDAAKKELKRLEGTWTATALTYNGKDKFANGQSFQFVIKGNEAVITGNDKVKKEYAKIQLKLDPTTKPKIVDITVTGGVQKDAALEGIYELKEDEFKICVRVFGLERPTKFESPEGSSIALLVLKREKP
jgi:uncharacterized protein (TIGR03067 family)